MKFLLIEDSKDTQFLIERMLKKYGIDLHVASDGEEGLDKSLNDSYDLILMDIKLPKIDGYEVTRILRSKGYTQPIVALTAYAMETDRNRSLQAGCDAHLSKPIDTQKLFSTLNTFLNQKIKNP